MVNMLFQASTLAALVPLVAAHGFINDPPARRPGDAYVAACGQQPYYQQSSDINGNVQGIMQVVGADATEDCKLWLCKGFQFDDNTDNVQTFSAGQTIDFDVDIAAPHTGFANVSIVDTTTDTILGVPLIEWDDYASNAGFPENNTAFSVTIPEDIGSECSEPGACVLQWFWDAPDIDQTYESCVDFVVGASNGGGQEPAPSSSAAPTPSATVPVPETSSVSATATPEPTVVTPPEDDEEEDDDCEEIPEDELPEEDEEEIPVEEEDDCEEIPDEELPEDDEEELPVEEEDPAEDDCEEIPDDADEAGEGDDGEYEEEFPTAAPGPALTTISTALSAPTVVPGNGDGDSGNNGNGGNAPQPTVTVTVTAAPVTVTAEPTACT